MSDATKERRRTDRRLEERRLMDRRHGHRGTPDRRKGTDRRALERREDQGGGDMRQGFVRFALEAGVLKFGEFKTKAGRLSPYFFNAGLFNDGKTLGRLADFYATALIKSGVEFDMLFGPAYKGITLASATAIALAGMGRNTPYAYNRKEAKDHGEGGTLVGAPVAGRVVIIDDVISAGTSVRESVQMIKAAGATPCAVLIALDRQERTGADDALSPHSAVQEVQKEYGLDVVSIATLDDILGFLETGVSAGSDLHVYRERVGAYREKYGA